MSKKVRPLHVGKFVPPPYAGVEAHVDTLLRSFLPEVESTLVAGRLEKHQPAETPYRSVTMRSFGRIAHLPLSPGLIPFVIKELGSGRSNLLHIHAPNPLGDLSALACAKDQPVVMTWHSDIVRQRKFLSLYRPIQKKILERVDRIIVATPKHYEISEQLHQVNIEKKINVIPYGIDFGPLDDTETDPVTLAALDRFSAGRKIVLTIGRHAYYKGYDYLLAAMAKVRPDIVLVMIGTGPMSGALLKQAGELGLDDRVIFLGEVARPALITALHRCDYFCLPSIEPSEAFGIATAEAKACGKPTIVCQLNNGVNYLTQHEVTGISVAPRDTSALANAIEVLAADDNLRKKMGIAARQWVRSNFSIQAMRDSTLKLYSELM